MSIVSGVEIMRVVRSAVFSAAFACLTTVVAAPVPEDNTIPKVNFRAVRFTPTQRFRWEFHAALGDYTLTGPGQLESFKGLPSGIRHVAFDPDGKQLYGIDNHHVYKIDLERKAAEEMKLPPNVPELSWPCGITFDTRRGRLIVVSFGGKGEMYSYTPKTGQWGSVTDLDNLDFGAFTYDARADSFYGLYESRPDRRPILGKFTPNGLLTDTFPLPDVGPVPKPIWKADGVPLQLIAADGHLILLKETELFLLDLKQGKARCTWQKQK